MQPIERPHKGMYHEQSSLWAAVSAAEHRERYAFAARKMSKALTDPADNWVGDLGCGNGESTFFLKEKLAESGRDAFLLGVDIDRLSIDAARRRDLSHCIFTQLDLGSPEFVAQLRFQADFKRQLTGITCIETLEHIAPGHNARIALTNIRALLEEDLGVAIISTPNRKSLSNQRYAPYNPYHTQELNVGEFLDSLKDAHLSVLGLYGQRYISTSLNEKLDSLRKLADSQPKYRKIIGGIILLITSLCDKNPRVIPLKDSHEPKYYLAVCKSEAN